MIQNLTSWRSPSNIALIKYWGKYGIQMPKNPSLSFTLDTSYSETSLLRSERFDFSAPLSIEFFFEEKPNPKFQSKIEKFLESIVYLFPFLPDYHWVIHSHNSFPHSAGIASSASSMSALGLCLCEQELILNGQTHELHDAFWHKASLVARLGSGSACRSVYGGLVVWGKSDIFEHSSQEYAVRFDKEIHPIFLEYRDTILIVSSEEKAVSSRAGHALMENNPFSEIRYQLAHQHLALLTDAIQKGDTETFITIVEKEALMLHALMMVSNPSFILMQPNTLAVIHKIQAFRHETQLPICFTLDAGPNVHILYPHYIEQKVLHFIENELSLYAENGKITKDFVGSGATRLVTV